MAQWQNRELDEGAADAVALMTLWIGATEADDARAAGYLAELLARPDGPARTVDGLQMLCGALLALFDYEMGVPPDAVLQTVGAMVAAARNSTPAPG